MERNDTMTSTDADVQRYLEELGAWMGEIMAKDTTDCPICKVGGVHNP